MTEERPQPPDGDRLAGLDRPLRNRVTPAGELIAVEARGTMYGNRGVLHNENLALVRRYQVRRWLACVLEFRGRRRPIMRPRRYTELFFLDEAVALAAGHRPCAECRHADYQSFRTAWTAARALPAKPAADDIDQLLHWQRRLVDGARVTYPALLSELPDGVFIVHDEEFWLANDGSLHRWTPAGYTDRIDQFDGPAAVLTPRATVEAIRAGYRPLMHPSAGSTGPAVLPAAAYWWSRFRVRLGHVALPFVTRCRWLGWRVVPVSAMRGQGRGACELARDDRQGFRFCGISAANKLSKYHDYGPVSGAGGTIRTKRAHVAPAPALAWPVFELGIVTTRPFGIKEILIFPNGRVASHNACCTTRGCRRTACRY